ncbi:hypothetical protein O6H91_19G029400 [Diphasiastrum complanatum]|uniref:Uncharacterized protein n=1 Tax=Diphasiastrum complanatum TaxID=34168 RepID=A0ACC2ATN4_DIPCM|nr:hypothetical protein O6H91_19G029400 [Diphasiastrum complanatum]
MFLIAGQPDKALKILVEHGPASKLIEVARKLKRTDADKLRLCANILQSNGLNSHAFETYTKLGDFRSVLLLHMELCQWDDAFAIKKLHPEIEEDVSLAYADWLVQNDRFEDAIVAYKQATRPELAKRLLKQLMRNAAKEKRSKDTAYYCWRIALESLSEWCETDRDHTAEEEKTAQEFMLSSEHAEIYYAYSFIDQSINEPFQTSQPETLFNIARFLLARVPKQMPYGVSLVNILVTLAKHSEQLGCYKIARHAYERLQALRVPSSWVDKIEVATLALRACSSPSEISKSHLEVPVCCRCTSPLPLFSCTSEDACSVCSQKVIRSFMTFDQLPLVEFVLERDITHQYVAQHLQANVSRSKSGANGHIVQSGTAGCRNSASRDDAAVQDDSFLARRLLIPSSESKPGPVRVDLATFNRMEKESIMIQYLFNDQKVPHYFYVVDPSVSLHLCPLCNHFFELEEWDLAILNEGSCPFCRGSGLC